MTANQLGSELTRAQISGSACVNCGTTEAPLHPGEVIEVRVAEGVVRDVETMLCTACLVALR